jgi:hypothetical protein
MESKFNGDNGILTRKHLKVKRITHIGKESDNLEETKHLGVGDDAYQRYADGSAKGKLPEDWRDIILKLKPQDVKRFGISRQVLSYWKGRIRMGKPIEVYEKTVIKLIKVMRKVINRSRYI